MASQPPPTFECSICCEAHDRSTSPPLIIEGDLLCHDCARKGLTDLFEAALANEFEPPLWGGIVLKPEDYEHALDPELIKRWKLGKEERETPLDLRVYCRHWVRDELAAGAVQAVGAKLEEVEIQDFGEPGARSGIEDKDKAVPTVEALQSTRECNAFVGKLHRHADKPDINECPVCGGDVCLGCRAGIAGEDEHEFVCGEYNTAESGHWRNQCPRYNHLDDVDAQYDEEDGFDWDWMSFEEELWREQPGNETVPEIDDVEIDIASDAFHGLDDEVGVEMRAMRFMFFVVELATEERRLLRLRAQEAGADVEALALQRLDFRSALWEIARDDNLHDDSSAGEDSDGDEVGDRSSAGAAGNDNPDNGTSDVQASVDNDNSTPMGDIASPSTSTAEPAAAPTTESEITPYLPTPALRSAFLTFYRLLRIQYEMRPTPDGHRARELYSRYQGYWLDLERALPQLTPEWRESEMVRAALELCRMEHARVARRLGQIAGMRTRARVRRAMRNLEARGAEQQ